MAETSLATDFGQGGGRVEPPLTTDQKLQIIRETREVFGWRAAQQMWFRLDLETVPEMYSPDAAPDPALARSAS